VIHGRPWRLLTTDELLYAPRNVRPQKAYGYGPVEQIVTTVNIALRRQIMQLQHFTEGNVPPGLLSAPDGWNAEQIKQFQEWFDAMLAGNTAERAKLIWGPSGTRYQAFKEAPYKDDFDEWLARIVCYAFSLPPTAFTKQVNRATAETSQDAALTEGLAPLMGWVKRLCDGVIQDRMGHADLEFAWSDVQTIDPKEQADILQAYVKEGIKTRNEARAILGDAPLPGGDALTVDTPQGPLKLADAPRPAVPVAKAGFNPAEPRTPKGEAGGGQWTDAGGTATLQPVQELLPFGPRLPFFFEEPPRTVRPFKEPIPRLSGKEGAKDIPSWARGNRPYVGESGRDFAKRLMDAKYGPGNWRTTSQEYQQIQKFGDRSFRDPGSMFIPDYEDDGNET
jgi:Phage portal protein